MIVQLTSFFFDVSEYKYIQHDSSTHIILSDVSEYKYIQHDSSTTIILSDVSEYKYI